MENYKKLLEYIKEITNLECMYSTLDWDMRISAPKDAKDYIISLEGDIADKIFKLQTDSKYKELLLNVINDSYFKELDDSEQRYINNLLKDYYKNVLVPNDFYTEYVKLCSKSSTVWEEAKEKNDYGLFKPYLEQVIDMTKKYYSYIDSSKDLYDVMLDCYEIGINSEIIDDLFNELKDSLIPLIKKCNNDSANNINVNYSDEELLGCAKYLLEYIGFDMNKGCLGIFAHGFTNKISSKDVRIAFTQTTNPIDFASTVVHEGGHGILEQNISDNLSKYTNGCIENLYAFHESQSRFFENILGKNINFWYPIYEDVKKKFKIDLSIEDFCEELNKVSLGLIRTKADELTYPLHIIIRYEIERDLFNGVITVDELPSVWNKKVKDYLGLDVKTDSEGLMQDIHWSEGSFGYFPSYLLGTIYDGIFKEYVEENLGSIDELLRNGRVKEITQFMIDNIYKNGGAYSSKEIIENVCGKKLTVKPIIKYFNDKYNK